MISPILVSGVLAIKTLYYNKYIFIIISIYIYIYIYNKNVNFINSNMICVDKNTCTIRRIKICY